MNSVRSHMQSLRSEAQKTALARLPARSTCGAILATLGRMRRSLQAALSSALPLILAIAGCASHEEQIARADEEAARAVIAARTGALEAALAGFERALALDGENLRALYNAGLAALELDRHDEARNFLERFVALRPDDAPGLVHLARAQALAGQRDAALAGILRAVEAGLDDPEALADGDFTSLAGDLRYMQALSLVSMRAGVRPLDDRGRLLVGGAPVRALDLPGVQTAAACEPTTALPE